MKTTIIQEGNEAEITYPCLMFNQELGVIVLFTEHGVGTVIYVKDKIIYNKRREGCHYSDFKMKYYKKLEGKIILEND